MNSHLFHLFLFLLLLSTFVALASPSEKNDQEPTKNDFQYLEKFKYYNDNEEMDARLVSLLIRYLPPKVDEFTVYLAVNVTRLTHRVLFKYYTFEQLLVSFLENNGVQLATDDDTQVDKIGIARRLALKARLALGRRTNDEELRFALSQCNDDWNMDDLFASILGQGDDADPESFKDALGRGWMQVSRELPGDSLETADDFDQHLAAVLPAEIRTVRDLRDVLQQARQTIRQEKLEAKNRQKPSDDDTRMSELLKPLLEAIADPHRIRTVMKQARQTLLLQNAVTSRKLYALRELVASGIRYPPLILKRILQRVISKKDFEILKILLQLPSLPLDIYRPILVNEVAKVISKPREGSITVVSLLLTSEHAVPPTTDEAYLYATTARHGPLLQVFHKNHRFHPKNPYSP